MLSRSELLHEKAWRRYRGSGVDDVDALMLWMQEVCFIQHPTKGSILIPLRPAQVEILRTWIDERYSIVLKARQIGWSTLVALYALWLIVFYEDQSIIMLSKGEREAEKLLQKATYAYQRFPQWMKDRGPKRTSRNLKKLSFDNNSVIESMPSKEDPGRSSTASLVVVDEWAFLENAEEAWASIEPIADIGGRVIGLSTANGSGDFFHRFWLMAEQGITDFKPMFFPWSANNDRDDEWYATKVRTMLEWQRYQEYPSNAEEAFIKSGNPVFDTDKLMRLEVVSPIRGYFASYAPIKAPEFRSDTPGPLSRFRAPEAGHAYVVGADVAEGLEYGDFSSAHVIDIRDGAMVAQWHGHIDADLFGDELVKLSYYYNAALLGVEVNNHGLATCKAIQRRQYPKLYYRKTLDERAQKWLTKVGWATTQKSKPLAIDDLVMAIREDSLVVTCAHTIAELRTFVRDDKGKMHGSPHDDRVMSLAIANQMRTHQREVVQTPSGEPGYMTMDWWRNLAAEDDKPTKQRLGAYNIRGQPNEMAV